MSEDDIELVKQLLLSATCNSLDPTIRAIWKRERDALVNRMESE